MEGHCILNPGQRSPGVIDQVWDGYVQAAAPKIAYWMGIYQMIRPGGRVAVSRSGYANRTYGKVETISRTHGWAAGEASVHRRPKLGIQSNKLACAWLQ